MSYSMFLGHTKCAADDGIPKIKTKKKENQRKPKKIWITGFMWMLFLQSDKEYKSSIYWHFSFKISLQDTKKSYIQIIFVMFLSRIWFKRLSSFKEKFS